MTDSENSDSAKPGNGPTDSGAAGEQPRSEQPAGERPGSESPPPADTGEHTTRFDPPSTEESPRAYSQVGRADTTRFEDQGQTTGFGPSDGFAPIPPNTDPGVVTTAPVRRKRSTGKIIAASSAALVILLVIAAVGSELYLRNKATDCMQSAFSDLTGTETSVSLSRKPMLLQGFGNDIPFVQIDTADKPGEMRLHARAEGIKGDGDSSTIHSLVGTGFVPFDRVVAMSKSMTSGADSSAAGAGQSGAAGLMQGATIDSMTGNAADGTIQVDSSVQLAFLPIPVSTTIKPTVQDGHVHFEVVKANAFIFGIPADFAQQVVDSVSDSLFGQLNQVTVKNLKVTDQGVDFAVDGDDVKLSGQVAGGSGDCKAA
ncbi:LmeA family phospholipid-binding protein [Gordonia sp. SL306]|uniref:LmeA family phospholipid-binding protein n=1 Tax=Gordonia sp. SL306 TaxID=2995145 RepID=UPI00227046F3|nr:LmeA family phospholipid-binding protein [Gordonia sp. SL306]WAC53877.1 LmeA family phospholipid-binding protein [Gordonia sp. SL306]